MNSSAIPRTFELRTPEFPTFNGFGTTLNCSSLNETVSFVQEIVDSSDRSRAFVVLTANVDHVVRLRANAEFASAYRSADWITIDGMPLLWATKLLGGRPHERVTGIDLLTALLSLAEVNRYRCFFLGAKQDVLDACIRNVEHSHPALQIAGSHDGYFKEDDDVLLEQINQSEPDILFVGMGSPRQELWVSQNKHTLRCALVLPVGGSFDVLAGRVTRAPKLLRRVGLEWSWRLALEPRRLWRRYLAEGPRFLRLVFDELCNPAPKGH